MPKPRTIDGQVARLKAAAVAASEQEALALLKELAGITLSPDSSVGEAVRGLLKATQHSAVAAYVAGLDVGKVSIKEGGHFLAVSALADAAVLRLKAEPELTALLTGAPAKRLQAAVEQAREALKDPELLAKMAHIAAASSSSPVWHVYPLTGLGLKVFLDEGLRPPAAHLEAYVNGVAHSYSGGESYNKAEVLGLYAQVDRWAQSLGPQASRLWKESEPFQKLEALNAIYAGKDYPLERLSEHVNFAGVEPDALVAYAQKAGLDFALLVFSTSDLSGVYDVFGPGGVRGSSRDIAVEFGKAGLTPPLNLATARPAELKNHLIAENPKMLTQEGFEAFLKSGSLEHYSVVYPAQLEPFASRADIQFEIRSAKGVASPFIDTGYGRSSAISVGHKLDSIEVQMPNARFSKEGLAEVLRLYDAAGKTLACHEVEKLCPKDLLAPDAEGKSLLSLACNAATVKLYEDLAPEHLSAALAYKDKNGVPLYFQEQTALQLRRNASGYGVDVSEVKRVGANSDFFQRLPLDELAKVDPFQLVGGKPAHQVVGGMATLAAERLVEGGLFKEPELLGRGAARSSREIKLYFKLETAEGVGVSARLPAVAGGIKWDKNQKAAYVEVPSPDSEWGRKRAQEDFAAHLRLGTTGLARMSLTKPEVLQPEPTKSRDKGPSFA